MNILVTGGAGFIGSHIVDRLLADGHSVRVLDNFSTGKPENLPDAADLDIIEGDVGDAATVDSAMRAIDCVYHEAAIASVQETVGNPLLSERTNYRGTLNVLEAARQAGTRRVVFACSAAVYGDLPDLPKREDMPTCTLSPYAVDKLASENACRVYHHLYGLETVALRYFNVFGPRQDPSSPYSGVISIFNDCLREGRTPVIYGDGEQTRDFIFVADVVEANIRAGTAETAAGKSLNIATGVSTSLNTLLETLAGLYDKQVSPEYREERAGDIRYSLADIGAAKDALGWRPEVSFEEGLRQLIT